MTAEIARSTYWESRYRDGSTAWDLGQPAPAFVELLSAAAAPPPGRAIVLGSGRGHDAIHFARRGFAVVGIDFAESAIATATETAEREGANATFMRSDIFALPSELGLFDYAIEHTCFCALPPERREDYVKLVHSLLVPNGELLAIFFTHDHPGGPPFGSQPADIHRLFDEYFEVQLAPIADSVAARRGEEHFGRLVRR